jgi:2-desacetyl-2-hydroxyethyl bacteriochlorophyllide A dehydrogenase
MSTSSLAQRIVFTGLQRVSLETFDPGVPGVEEVLIRTETSLISTGTETIVFNRNFDAGSLYDRWVKYPFYPGYASIGVVAALGDGVTSLAIGDRVAFRTCHCSHANIKVAACYRVPGELPATDAVWFAMAKIAFHGALAARHRLGDSVLIIGAGPIGQMATRWAYAAGVANLFVVDPLANRMVLAKAGGATAVIAAPIDQARDAILAANGAQLPRVVIDSTGNAAVFSAALGLVANHGLVVLLGNTGQPAQQVITGDVLRRGITIAGVHDTHNTPEWNDATITQLCFQLARTGRFSLSGLNTHWLSPTQCEDAYTIATREKATAMGVLFDWSK